MDPRLKEELVNAACLILSLALLAFFFVLAA